MRPVKDVVSLETRGEGSTDSPDLFREEALDEHRQGLSRLGEIVRVSPAWTGWIFPLILAVLAATLAFVLFGSIGEYAEGPAIVRVGGDSDVTANTDGVVSSVAAVPGRAVAKGDPLILLYDGIESTELDRVEKEFDLQLLTWLRNPSDPFARQSLGLLRARKEFAEARRGERVLRAPHAGVVSDVRARAGQHVAPGETLLTLLVERPRISVVAMLPGHHRPLIEKGMTVQVELAGYRGVQEELTIESIGQELVGPAAARRYLGPEIGDTVPIPGPVVIVEAVVPGRTFGADGREYEYHDGMQAYARVRVRSERPLAALLPGLRRRGDTEP